MLKDGAQISNEDLRSFLAEKSAKWQVRDNFVFLAELPHHLDGKPAEVRAKKAVQQLRSVKPKPGSSLF
jgi:fatty-acyl-CoA synthase